MSEMKKIVFVFLFILFGFALFSQENVTVQEDIIFNENIVSENENLDPKTGFPVIKEKPFVVYNEGIAASWVTRIMKQDNRSNFVFSDFLAGAFFSIIARNMEPIDLTIRFTAYYPVSYKFNGHPQVAASPLHFACDLYVAPTLKLTMWNYVYINLSGGLHFLFQNSDRWNYIDLGVGGLAGLELPLTKRWTILIDGIASYDYGNFGTNKNLEPYSYVWQYQLSFGIRYSKAGENKYSYIDSKRKVK